jgi:mRNA-degrading endonuclease RelE of RelBE toxin-antitoxin system
MRIEVSEQVREYLRTCPPEPRRLLRAAIRKLATEQGDLKILTRELTGYHRLRVKSYRVIFRYKVSGSERTIFCAFAEHRGVVYETFLNLLH